MKVNIQHKEDTTGVLRKTTLRGVELSIQFSEEERAVIEARDLKYDIVLERGYSADVPEGKAIKQENRGLGRALLNAAVNGRDANTTNLTINKLMNGPDLYFLSTPLEAKSYEDELEDRFVQLKCISEIRADCSIGQRGLFADQCVCRNAVCRRLRTTASQLDAMLCLSALC